MAIKSNLIGGIDYATPTARIKPTDLNDTNNAIINQSINLAQVPYTTLKSTGEWTNEGGLLADRFTTAIGVNSTVQVDESDSAFLDNKYSIGFDVDINSDTNSTVGSWSNISNAFDGDSSTFASASGTVSSGSRSLGKTFTERFVNKVSYVCAVSQGAFAGTISMIIETYDGSVWTDRETIISTSNLSSGIVSGDFDLNLSVQGVRIKFVKSGSSTSFNNSLYYLNYGVFDTESELVCKTSQLDGNENTVTLYNNSVIPVDTSLHATISDGTLETDEFELSGNKSTIIPLLDNMSGDMTIKFIFRTTDNEVTPELFGYGVSKQ